MNLVQPMLCCGTPLEKPRLVLNLVFGRTLLVAAPQNLRQTPNPVQEDTSAQSTANFRFQKVFLGVVPRGMKTVIVRNACAITPKIATTEGIPSA